MVGPVKLRGMTWNHPRGYDPMVACSALYERTAGVSIHWDRRSLQDFESFPVEQLAREYDLIVIDHPHVGQITKEGCLVPLDSADRNGALLALAAGSVGPSFSSYQWIGRQWALPIDAATQVQAYRKDMTTPCKTWSDVMELAERGEVLIPLRPPHSLMTFYSLCANLGMPCASEPAEVLIGVDAASEAYDRLSTLVARLDPSAFDMDPIAVSEVMVREDARISCAPYIYGYVNYAMKGFRGHQLTFTDMPAAGSSGPSGSALGGTGIAVSAFSDHVAEALDFAFWVASAATQKGPYAEAGGQPGIAAAWEDDAVNAATGDFYRATRATLQHAWVRPRHNGYMPFQHAASERLNAGLKNREACKTVVDDLNALHRSSFQQK